MRQTFPEKTETIHRIAERVRVERNILLRAVTDIRLHGTVRQEGPHIDQNHLRMLRLQNLTEPERIGLDCHIVDTEIVRGVAVLLKSLHGHITGHPAAVTHQNHIDRIFLLGVESADCVPRVTEHGTLRVRQMDKKITKNKKEHQRSDDPDGSLSHATCISNKITSKKIQVDSTIADDGCQMGSPGQAMHFFRFILPNLRPDR